MQNSFDSTLSSEQRNRALDKFLGQKYREDQSVADMTYAEYKQHYLDSLKIKRMKVKYSAFEPLPFELAKDFKKRMKTIILNEPIETIEEYENRVGKAFHK